MRTKTLLVAAAAFAFSIAISQADGPVYSQNVVGYVNTPLTAGTLSVVAPCLDVDGTGTNNTILSVFGTNNVTLGDVVYVFNGTGYDSLNYQKVGLFGTPGWYLGATLTNNYVLNPGISVFYAPYVNETNTQTGTVLQGTNIVIKIPGAGNISLVASAVPLAGGVTTTLQYQPTLGDVIYIYNGSGYDTYNYQKVGLFGTPGWYLGATPQEPQIPVGGGFWLQPYVTTNWVQNFTVQ